MDNDPKSKKIEAEETKGRLRSAFGDEAIPKASDFAEFINAYTDERVFQELEGAVDKTLVPDVKGADGRVLTFQTAGTVKITKAEEKAESWPFKDRKAGASATQSASPAANGTAEETVEVPEREFGIGLRHIDGTLVLDGVDRLRDQPVVKVRPVVELSTRVGRSGDAILADGNSHPVLGLASDRPMAVELVATTSGQIQQGDRFSLATWAINMLFPKTSKMHSTAHAVAVSAGGGTRPSLSVTATPKAPYISRFRAFLLLAILLALYGMDFAEWLVKVSKIATLKDFTFIANLLAEDWSAQFLKLPSTWWTIFAFVVVVAFVVYWIKSAWRQRGLIVFWERAEENGAGGEDLYQLMIKAGPLKTGDKDSEISYHVTHFLTTESRAEQDETQSDLSSEATEVDVDAEKPGGSPKSGGETKKPEGPET